MTTETTPLHPLLVASASTLVPAADHFNYTLKEEWSGAGGCVAIAPASLYGYWERPDGSEGGGLWFWRTEAGGLELLDYDGAGALPRGVVHKLRAWGVQVDSDCMA